MATYSFNSPKLQGVSTPLSVLSQNSKPSPAQHSPVVSYVVPSNVAPVRVVSSPNLGSASGAVLSPSQGATQNPQTREISTVYLPPIRYRYDNATGRLVQIGGPSPANPQVQSPVSSRGQKFTQFSPPLGSYSPNPGQPENVKSQNVHVFSQSTQPAFTTDRFTNLPHAPHSPTHQPWLHNLPPTFGQPGPQEGVNFHPGNAAFSNARPQYPDSHPPFNQGPYAGGNKFGNAQFRASPPGFSNFGFPPNTSLNTPRAFQTDAYGSTQGFGGVPTFGNPSSFANAQPWAPPQGYPSQPAFGDTNPFAGAGNGRFANVPNHLYTDTPRARYEAAVRDYYDRMNGNFQNYNPHPESPNGLAQAFSTFENVASKFLSGTDGLVSDFKNVASRIFNPNGDYHKAAVFRLQRLDGVPVNPKSVSKLSFSVVAYFDPATENYNVHKTDKHWALPTELSDVVDCDFKGATVKIPWRGEEFVFLKVMEHVGHNRLVLGRLQLKMDNLVAGRPLKVTIMGEDGHTKGNAIFEFSVGSLTLEELKQMNLESARSANHALDLEDRSRRNLMPEYEEALEQGSKLEKGQQWPQTRLRAKGPRARHEVSGGFEISSQGGFPGPLRYLASWCCDITDQDLD